MSFGARALIRLGALKHNLEVIRTAAPAAKIMAVIKANAYGHGMLAVAKTLGNADALAVARVSEALKLRASGIDTPIVLLSGVFDSGEMQAALEHDLELVVHCPEQIDLLESCSDHGALVVWLKFDTGMNRLGFDPSGATALIERTRRIPAIRELRLMTHLSSADDLNDATTTEQVQRFSSLAEGFDGAVSIGNSAGALAWPAISAPGFAVTGEHWIRPGIALFGVSPIAGRTAAELNLQAVMQFEARLVAVKRLSQGARVGYKGSFESAADTMLGIVSAGYGDGYSRHFRSGTPVLINERRVALIGNVSMDMIAVDLGPQSRDKVGDIATLWGDDLPLEEVAPWANTIPYELACGVINREASEIVA